MLNRAQWYISIVNMGLLLYIALAKKVFENFADEKAYAEFEKGFGISNA
jgi:hypothetical protein